ncbi:bacterial regulatory, luxR family protein [Lysobacter antibioticus]|uniref:Bacterial regulatory, luxR family protein n=1 Tax=Lysobacter antibioticus TaxID=84531 RepID=A0A0S2FHQ5_LYSAN|nr:bacterial regulatory, luxR family protein [Lysobacter antibioticus]
MARAAISFAQGADARCDVDVDVVRALLSKNRPARAKFPVMPMTGLLSERERNMLRIISLGASNKMTAQKLSISPSTVRTHIESVFRKLECSTRAAATLKATQLGMLYGQSKSSRPILLYLAFSTPENEDIALSAAMPILVEKI